MTLVKETVMVIVTAKKALSVGKDPILKKLWALLALLQGRMLMILRVGETIATIQNSMKRARLIEPPIGSQSMLLQAARLHVQTKLWDLIHYQDPLNFAIVSCLLLNMFNQPKNLANLKHKLF